MCLLMRKSGEKTSADTQKVGSVYTGSDSFVDYKASSISQDHGFNSLRKYKLINMYIVHYVALGESICQMHKWCMGCKCKYLHNRVSKLGMFLLMIECV